VRSDGRRTLGGIGAVLVVLLVSSCGGPGPGTTQKLPADYHGVPAPPFSTSTASPPGTPQSAGTPLQTLTLDMEWDLYRQVGSVIPVQPDCASELAGDNVPQTTIPCNAVWNGVAIPFSVTFDISTAGLIGLYSVSVTQLQGLLVGPAILQAWSNYQLQNYDQSDMRSCESDLPAAQLVPFGKPTAYRCAVDTEIFHVELDYKTAHNIGVGDINSPYVDVTFPSAGPSAVPSSTSS
jgi:hypothetical protein